MSILGVPVYYWLLFKISNIKSIYVVQLIFTSINLFHDL